MQSEETIFFFFVRKTPDPEQHLFQLLTDLDKENASHSPTNCRFDWPWPQRQVP